MDDKSSKIAKKLNNLKFKIMNFDKIEESLPDLRAGLDECLRDPHLASYTVEFAIYLQFALSRSGRQEEALAIRKLLPLGKSQLIETRTDCVSAAARNQFDRDSIRSLLEASKNANSVWNAMNCFSEMASFLLKYENWLPVKQLSKMCICLLLPEHDSGLDWEFPKIVLSKGIQTKETIVDQEEEFKKQFEETVRKFWASYSTQMGNLSIELTKQDNNWVVNSIKLPLYFDRLVSSISISRMVFLNPKIALGLEMKQFEHNTDTSAKLQTIVKEMLHDIFKKDEVEKRFEAIPNGENFWIHLYDNLIYDPLYLPDPPKLHLSPEMLALINERKKKRTD